MPADQLKLAGMLLDFQIRRPLEGHPLPQIHHLVGSSEIPCYGSKMMFAVRNHSGSEPKPELLNKIVQFPKDYQQVLQQVPNYPFFSYSGSV